MFEPEELERLVPRSRGEPSLAEADEWGADALDPLASTELLAYDFLLKGGKRLRPFITLAVYDAMTGAHGSASDGARALARLPDGVKRVALAMEVFHKASLVHDDVEDDDAFRYGHPTLHRTYGTPLAINVGDYLIGLGYRLIAAERETLGTEVVADVLARLGEAHTKLCEGQGAELAWRDSGAVRLTPLEALKIYALKTAPAFEAALWAGLRLAGPAGEYRQAAARFARHLGVAFQIVNDLDDWDHDQPNKRSRGTDVLGGRPTVLWALALEGLPARARRELESVVEGLPNEEGEARIARVRQLYDQADVYDKAAGLITKHRQRARQAADEIEADELRHLLHYFVDTVVPRRNYE
jgi:geranylgeranyl pyrophosphate synthase